MGCCPALPVLACGVGCGHLLQEVLGRGLGGVGHPLLAGRAPLRGPRGEPVPALAGQAAAQERQSQEGQARLRPGGLGRRVLRPGRRQPGAPGPHLRLHDPDAGGPLRLHGQLGLLLRGLPAAAAAAAARARGRPAAALDLAPGPRGGRARPPGHGRAGLQQPAAQEGPGDPGGRHPAPVRPGQEHVLRRLRAEGREDRVPVPLLRAPHGPGHHHDGRE
mmetsp:Transcript_22936/g.72172  ORF Transcript_22936/g.72172 Transcript_22936/m.72172 type:complete len:219 (+) Transcript_22936:937-1593(+)